MTLRSLGGSSRNVQAGRTIIRFQKPMAAGTRTYSDVATVIDLEANDTDALIASTVFRTAGSRSAATSAMQLRRSRRRRQSPVAKRAIAALAPRIHARKAKSAQRPGTVIAGRPLPAGIPPDIPDDIPAAIGARPAPKPPSKGSAATASNARNQTANRVPEFCLRKTRSIAQAKSAIRNPSGSALRIRSTDICATVCTGSQLISRRSDLCGLDLCGLDLCRLEPASAAGERVPPAQCPGPRGDSRQADR